MRLIDTYSFELVEFQACPVDTYAILSHTWGSVKEETSFEEFKAGRGRNKPAFWKIQKLCEQARDDGIKYAWADTCCIEKRSSSELSEAINSMFTWYQSARICYVYLADVLDFDSNISELTPTTLQSNLSSRWFTRGWTLQELIAPKMVYFYTRNWMYIGDKSFLAPNLQAVTGIGVDILRSTRSHLDCSIAQRMSWASQRNTTRLEDSAYCLIGLFSISMPLLYGEGSKAFIRLQEAIIEQTNDESRFAWTGVSEAGSGLLAPDISHFTNSANIVHGKQYCGRPPFVKTNHGISIELEMLPCDMNTYVCSLQCDCSPINSERFQLALFICRTSKDNQYRRIPFEGKCIADSKTWEMSKAIKFTIFVPDDGRDLELSPHHGLPSILIESNLKHRSLRAKPNDTKEIQVRKKEPSFQDLEIGITTQGMAERNGDHRLPLTPEANPGIEFRSSSHDLERGVYVAFELPENPHVDFRYRLQVEFDASFNPICVLDPEAYRMLSRLSSANAYYDRQLLTSLWSTSVDPNSSYPDEAKVMALSQNTTPSPTASKDRRASRFSSAPNTFKFKNNQKIVAFRGDRIKGLKACINDHTVRLIHVYEHLSVSLT